MITKTVNSGFSSSSLLFFLLFFIVIFTMILTIAKNCHNFLRNIPVSIVFKNAWYTFVTSTTVGYGDRCPTTKVGKFVGFFWIGISLILICIFTASISGSVLGDIDTEFQGGGRFLFYLTPMTQILFLKITLCLKLFRKNYMKML